MYLKYGCVKLRAIETEDQELLKLLINSPEVEQTTVGWNLPVSSYQQNKWQSNSSNSMDCIRWIIELENQTVLGMISLMDVDWKNRSANINIKLNPYEKNRIRGDAKDAYYAVLSYAFDELGLNRIEHNTLEYNFFSLKLSRSMGFVDEGIKRKCIYKFGKWHDLIVGGLLNEEFKRYDDGTAPWQNKS